jgi:hypothetical protein
MLPALGRGARREPICEWRMDTDRFDALTRALIGRRSALAFLTGGVGTIVSSAPLAEARKKKKRCRKSGRACGKDKQCCGKLDCAEGVCCKPERVFVNCSDICLCPDNESLCCAYEPDPPELCAGPEYALEFCCPAEDVCGDVCCLPQEVCVAGECVCRPENVCGAYCCNPDNQICNQETEICDCTLPNPPGCPSGTGGFSRVRRVR